jgi:lipopolysaccharide transport system ATP-binding protein
MSNYAIRAEGLGKRYRIGRHEKYKMLRDTLLDAASSTWDAIQSIGQKPSDAVESEYRPTIWALKDASFEIQPGDSVGIIGSNGAGKTTLLKILSRVTAPTTGRVHLRGRVGSLLEVGTGFHPELTGRENIFLNGAILGMKKAEIDRKFDEIVEFSEVEKFLDTPVKFFSSGMRVRLAFSVAAHLEPDILLVDEVLAVGDVAFQKKSLGKMDEVAHQGRTVLFVSHNMAAIKSLCRIGIYIEKGLMKYCGGLDQAIDMYLGSGELQKQTQLRLEPDPSQRAQILEVAVLDVQGRADTRFPHDEPFTIQIKAAIREPVPALGFSVVVFDSELNPILNTYDFEEDESRLERRVKGEYNFHLRIPPIFAPDEYRLSVRAIVLHPKREYTLHNVEHVCPFEIYDNGSLRSRVNARWAGKLSIPVHWDEEVIPAEAGGQ